MAEGEPRWEHFRCKICGQPNQVQIHEYYLSEECAEEIFRRINMALSPEIATLTKDINAALARISKVQTDLNTQVADLKAQIVVLKSASGLSDEDKSAITTLDTAARGIDVPEPPVSDPPTVPTTPPSTPSAGPSASSGDTGLPPGVLP